MKPELLNKIANFLRKDENSSLLGKPATDEQIKIAESQIAVSLDKGYIDFIKTFGGSFAGLPVHAFENGSSIGKEDIVQLTQQFRTWFANEKIFPEIKSSYVISIDGSGNPIIIDVVGKIFLLDIDTNEKTLIANSFEDLIENNFYEW